jgi:hypothetical protein
MKRYILRSPYVREQTKGYLKTLGKEKGADTPSTSQEKASMKGKGDGGGGIAFLKFSKANCLEHLSFSRVFKVSQKDKISDNTSR